MLRIITAPHGGGKTTYITGALDIIDGKTFFLVPEQSHFETERRLYKELGAKAVSMLNITSFTKLSKEILGFYNQKKPYADEAVREAVMQKTLRQLKPDYYNNSNAQSALNLIALFQNQGISPQSLKTAAQSIDTSFGSKLFELASVYDTYSSSLCRTFGDRLDDVKNAAVLAGLHGFFKGARIYADSFDGFTGSQMLLIEVMMAQGDLILTLPYADTGGYSYNGKVVTRLKLAAQRANVKITQTALTSPERTPHTTTLMTAPDVYSECDYIAATVRALVTKDGYKLSDIAVISPNKTMLPLLMSSFDVYGLNVFADIPEAIIEKPPVRFILTALDAADFKDEAIISYIKSGFVRVRIKRANGTKNNGSEYIPCTKSRRLSGFEINKLIRAYEIWRLTAADWRNPFPDSNKELFILEPLRREIINPLIALSDKLRETSGDKLTEALADFLINTLEMPATITGLINRGAAGFEKGFKIDSDLNEEYRKLWDLVISVFESIHTALRGYNLPLSEYTDILRSVFAKTATARPPQVIDAVTIGDAERTHTSNIKVLFVAGANQGVFPRSIKTEGGFTADELDIILDAGIELCDDRKGRYYKERYIVNKALSIPSELLYISASHSGLLFEKTEISPVFEEQAALKGLKIQKTTDLPLELWISTKRAAMLFYAREASNRQNRKAIGDFLRRLGESDYADWIDDLYRTKFQKDRYRYKISSKNAEGLLGRQKYSPSVIMSLNSCRYKYFCEYGLRIKPYMTENGDELNPMQKGNLIHYCLEGILKDYLGNYSAFLSLGESEIMEAVRTKAGEYIENELSFGLPRTKRQTEIIKTYLPHIKKNILQIQRDMTVTKFRPVAFEKRVSVVLDGITIEGIADRIDIMESGGDTYVNVIDYKTGAKAFDFPALYYGLGWQVLLYMYPAEEQGTASSAVYRPGGFGMLSKLVEIPPNADVIPDAKDSAANWLDFHRVKGVHFINPARPDGMKDLEALKTACKTATGRKANYIELDFLDEKQRRKLTAHFIQQLKNTLHSLMAGNVEAVPLAMPFASNNGIPCQYCDYKSICHNKGSLEIIEAKSEAIYGLLSEE